MNMRIRRKNFTVLAMRIRTPKLDVQTNSLLVDRFDHEDVENFLAHIVALPDRNYNLGDKFLFLDSFNDNMNNNFYTGWFASARYGETPDWIDANTMGRRRNNKRITEGEENLTYFVLNKQTGLFLLQSDSKRIATGSAVDNYFRSKVQGFEGYIQQYNRLHQGNLMINTETFIQLDYSIDTSFMEEVRNLARIKKTTIECDVIQGRANNVVEAIENHLNGVDEYDRVEFSVVNTQRRMGIRAIEEFIEGLQDRHLYRNVVVTGTTQLGRPKKISWENHAKKFEVRVQINQNGLVFQEDMLARLIELGLRENP